jgi:hypothetical protein
MMHDTDKQIIRSLAWSAVTAVAMILLALLIVNSAPPLEQPVPDYTTKKIERCVDFTQGPEGQRLIIDMDCLATE